MRIQRRGMALLAATAIVSLWAFAVACGDEESPWPQTVLSGNPGGGVGGGSEGEADANTGDDTGIDDAGEDVDTGTGFVALFSCETFSSGTGYCTTYKNVLSATATQLEASCTNTTGSVLLANALCPQGTLSSTEGATVGCCISTSSGYTTEQCFYGSNTNALGTTMGCVTPNTLVQQPQ